MRFFVSFFLSYSIWFAGFRREVLKAMNSNYADELRYSKEMIEEHPKNYQVMNVNMYLIIKQKMPGTFDFLFFAMGANSQGFGSAFFFADPYPGKNLHADPDPDPGGIRGRGVG